MPESGDKLSEKPLPECNQGDPGDLAAWYGSFGFYEDFRKVVISNCKEIVRARHAVGKKGISEARINDLAHLHDNYLDFLCRNLNGRRLWERNVRDSRTGA